MSAQRCRTSVIATICASLIAASTTLAQAQVACVERGQAVEIARLGGIDGEYAFSTITRLQRGPDGLLYMSQAGEYSIQVYSPEGVLLTQIGRRGDGPGEFSAPPWRFGWVHGRFWAADNRALLFFLADGAEEYRVTFQATAPGEASFFRAGRPLPDGSFLGQRVFTPPVDAFFEAHELPLLRFDADGRVVDTLAIVPQLPTVLGSPTSDGMRIIRYNPIGEWRGESDLPVAVAADGRSMILVASVHSADSGGNFELVRTDLAGDTVFSRTIAYDPVPISRRDRVAIETVFAKSQSGTLWERQPESATTRRVEAQARDALTLPRHYPPVRRILTGDDGTIWLLRQAWPAPSDLWEVRSAEGSLRGKIEITSGRGSVRPWEPRMMLHSVDAGVIIGVTLGQFDEPYIHWYSLRGGCVGNPATRQGS